MGRTGLAYPPVCLKKVVSLPARPTRQGKKYIFKAYILIVPVLQKPIDIFSIYIV